MEQSPADQPTRLLIACIGNIFLGDDGFGVEVARRLAGRRYPPGVEVTDFGIRGIELAYTLLDGCDTLVLVDAVSRGGLPGTLYLIEPDLPATGAAEETTVRGVAMDAHSMDPARVLTFARSLGAQLGRVLLIGCEPERLVTDHDDLELRMGLSKPVLAAVDEAVTMVDSLIARLLAAPPVEARESAPL